MKRILLFWQVSLRQHIGQLISALIYFEFWIIIQSICENLISDTYIITWFWAISHLSFEIFSKSILLVIAVRDKIVVSLRLFCWVSLVLQSTRWMYKPFPEYSWMPGIPTHCGRHFSLARIINLLQGFICLLRCCKMEPISSGLQPRREPSGSRCPFLQCTSGRWSRSAGCESAFSCLKCRFFPRQLRSQVRALLGHLQAGVQADNGATSQHREPA